MLITPVWSWRLKQSCSQVVELRWVTNVPMLAGHRVTDDAGSWISSLSNCAKCNNGNCSSNNNNNITNDKNSSKYQQQCCRFFERRLWCRHLCPIGGMNGMFAKLSMTELRSRQGVCSGDLPLVFPPSLFLFLFCSLPLFFSVHLLLHSCVRR